MTDTEQLAAAVSNLDERVGDLDRRITSLTLSIDAADRVNELIRLVVDAPGCEVRLAALRKEAREIMRTHTELVSEQARLADDRRALGLERKALVKDKEDLLKSQAEVAYMHEFYCKRGVPPAARLRQFPNGMVAAADHEPPDRRLDPVYGARAREEPVEMVTERVGPSSGTLTRSVPRPKRSMRRGADA
jgi:hypothetical protein